MRSAFPLLAALALVGVLAWLLLGSSDEATEELPYLPQGGPTDPETDEAAMTADPATELTGSRTGPKRPKRSHDPHKPFKERLGVLEILPIDPDGEPIPADDCTVLLERVRGAEPLGKLGPRARETTQVWRFEKVPIGTVRVIVKGDRLIESRHLVRVREGTTTYRKLPVELGAMVTYRVELPGGDLPKEVTLELVNPQGRQAEVWWEVRSPRLMISPRRAKSVTLPGEGLISGIPPGAYYLRARTKDEPVYAGRTEVLVAAGDALDVTLFLR